jgi:hypothetical protein
MLRQPNYAMVTIRLPLNGEGDQHVGRWEVTVRGEGKIDKARTFHVLALVDDHETHLVVKLKKHRWTVGDLIPVAARLNTRKRAVTLKDLRLNTSALRRPLTEILADFHSPRACANPLNALSEKLKRLVVDPRLAKALVPQHRSFGWLEGNISTIARTGALETTFVAESPGLLNVKLVAIGEDEYGGPIQRTTRLSMLIEPGRANASRSKVAVTKVVGKVAGTQLIFTPKSADGYLLGAGRGHEFVVNVAGKAVSVDVVDDLNGTYRFIIPGDVSGKAVLMMANTPVWKGEI